MRVSLEWESGAAMTFSKTGPKRMKDGAAARAWATSARVWQEMLTTGSGRPAEA